MTLNLKDDDMKVIVEGLKQVLEIDPGADDAERIGYLIEVFSASEAVLTTNTPT